MPDSLNRLLGDTPARTMLKLIVASLIVGFLMNIFGLMPADLIGIVHDFVLEIWESGFEALGSISSYLLLGATIVLPIFIVIRLLNYRR